MLKTAPSRSRLGNLLKGSSSFLSHGRKGVVVTT